MLNSRTFRKFLIHKHFHLSLWYYSGQRKAQVFMNLSDGLPMEIPSILKSSWSALCHVWREKTFFFFFFLIKKVILIKCQVIEVWISFQDKKVFSTEQLRDLFLRAIWIEALWRTFIWKCLSIWFNVLLLGVEGFLHFYSILFLFFNFNMAYSLIKFFLTLLCRL